MNLLRENDLFAVDSLFKPKRSRIFCEQRKRVCNATYLQKDSKRRPKKLDYSILSNRLRSCITKSETKWAPSIHRFGRPFDHSLLRTEWKWQIKADKRPPVKDYKNMTVENWQKLGNQIKANLNDVEAESSDTTQKETQIAERLSRMNTAINDCVTVCVPNRDKKAGSRRRVSDKTRSILAESVTIQQSGGAGQRVVKVDAKTLGKENKQLLLVGL